MPTRHDRRPLYLIENIGGCVRTEGLGKGQISGVEQNQGPWFNLKRRAEHAKPRPPERIMSISIGELCPRLILTLTDQEVEES